MPSISSRSSHHDSPLLSLRQIAAMLAARRWLILGVLAATVLCTAVLVALIPRSWTASADIFIDYKESDPVTGRTFSALLDDGYMQTQIDLLNSRRVSELAIDNLSLRQGADYADAAMALGPDRADEDLKKSVVRNTKISGSKGSRVLTVSYTADSPQKARDTANAIVSAYFQITQDMNLAAVRARDELYQNQLEQLRRKTDAIQQALADYEQQTGLLNAQEENDVDMRRLQTLSMLLLEVRNKRQSTDVLTEKIKDLHQKGMNASLLPEIAQLGSIQALKDKRNEVERRIGEVGGELGPNHPTMRGLQAARAQLSQQLKQEAQAAFQGLSLERERLQAQESALTEEIRSLENNLLAQKAQRVRVAAYQRQLASAEQSYAVALQKYDSLPAIGDSAPSAMSIMRKAELPSEPSAPNVLRSLLASLFAGLAIGTCLALALELAMRRIRSAEDIEHDAALPVLGTIGLAR